MTAKASGTFGSGTWLQPVGIGSTMLSALNSLLFCGSSVTCLPLRKSTMVTEVAGTMPGAALAATLDPGAALAATLDPGAALAATLDPGAALAATLDPGAATAAAGTGAAAAGYCAPAGSKPADWEMGDGGGG